MADELNTPTHRWHQPRNNISLPKMDFSKQTIYDSGIQKIDAWINSQPWGNPVPGLFALAEPGVWYDPSDLNTLFQNAAGTIPVTAAGQPVGLVLDKSKGLVLGPELIGNGTFADPVTTGWTPTGGTLSVVDGWLRLTSSASPAFAGYSFTSVAGRTYVISGQWRSSAGSWRLIVGTASGGSTLYTPSIGASGSFTAYVQATGTTTWISVRSSVITVGDFVEIDNISVRELPGFHATQATAASRPTYGVDATGRGYLSFDGVDDFLVTPTITPGTDKAQVFAGVRKLSDAARGMLVELGPPAATGTLRLEAPSAASPNYFFLSTGTASAGAGPVVTYAAPISNVLSGLSDISGDLATFRVNGTQVSQSTADQGTGNYSAQPLYIGRRGGTTLPFNGRLYSLIARFGANLDANTISQTETWVNSKTGAY